MTRTGTFAAHHDPRDASEEEAGRLAPAVRPEHHQRNARLAGAVQDQARGVTNRGFGPYVDSLFSRTFASVANMASAIVTRFVCQSSA